MMPRNALIAELVQLLPIVSFALPFIVHGEVELERAGDAFALAAALTVPVIVIVLALHRLLNPILVGVAVWLWAGALAFHIPIPALVRFVVATQSFGLFLAVFAVGLLTTLAAPHGFVGSGSGNEARVRRASWLLLALTAIAMGWAWWFRHDIRLGGGAPFIALNVARRALARRASKPAEPGRDEAIAEQGSP